MRTFSYSVVVILLSALPAEAQFRNRQMRRQAVWNFHEGMNGLRNHAYKTQPAFRHRYKPQRVQYGELKMGHLASRKWLGKMARKYGVKVEYMPLRYGILGNTYNYAIYGKSKKHIKRFMAAIEGGPNQPKDPLSRSASKIAGQPKNKTRQNQPRKNQPKNKPANKKNKPANKKNPPKKNAPVLAKDPLMNDLLKIAKGPQLPGDVSGSRQKATPRPRQRRKDRSWHDGQMRIAAVSDGNLDHRGENQDVMGQATNRRGDLMFVVADGAGGHKGGRQAARKAVNVAEDLFKRTDRSNTGQILKRIYKQVNQAVLRAKARGEEIGVSTIVAAVITKGGRLVTANLGDSRAYVIRGDDGSRTMQELRQVTRDHNGPKDHIITEYVGKAPHKGSLDIDIKDFGKLRSGDRVLLSSDGLHKFVSHSEIQNHMRRKIDVNIIARNLVQLAKDRGANDNITLQIYQHP